MYDRYVAVNAIVAIRKILVQMCRNHSEVAEVAPNSPSPNNECSNCPTCPGIGEYVLPAITDMYCSFVHSYLLLLCVEDGAAEEYLCEWIDEVVMSVCHMIWVHRCQQGKSKETDQHRGRDITDSELTREEATMMFDESISLSQVV